MSSGIALIIKIFGIGMGSIIMSEILDSQGNGYGRYIKIGGTVICLGLLMSEVGKMFDVVIKTFNLY